MAHPLIADRLLRIRFKKKRDGRPTLACHRPDASVAVQQLPEAFPAHDFTHYAVESTLGLRRAFLGLMADGWSFEDFGAPWPRGRLPPEAGWAEHLVGIFWREVWPGGEPQALDDINWAVERASEAAGYAGAALTAETVEAIRRTQHDLVARWRALPPGGTLELTFPAPDPP